MRYLSNTISRIVGSLISSTTHPDCGKILSLAVDPFSLRRYSRAVLGAPVAIRSLSSRRSDFARSLHLIRVLRIVVQQLVENIVVIVNTTLLHVLKPFGNCFQQTQTVDGVIDGGILRHSLDDVNDFL